MNAFLVFNEIFFNKKFVKLPRKLIKKLCFCCRGHYFLCMKAQARVEFHMKHKRGSDFKRLRIVAMKKMSKRK